MRLIDADARVTVQSFDEEHEEYVHTEMSVEEALDFATDEGCPPVVEAVPVKHGRWIPVDSYSAFGGSEEVWRAHGNPTAYHYCSECKNQSRLDEFGDEILSKYCPDCGAQLEEEDDGQE